MVKSRLLRADGVFGAMASALLAVVGLWLSGGSLAVTPLLTGLLSIFGIGCWALLRRSMPRVSVWLGLIAGVGAGVQIRLNSSPTQSVVLLLAGVVIGFVLLMLSLRLQPDRQRRWGLVLALGVFVAAGFTIAWDLASGSGSAALQSMTLDLPVLPAIKVGEVGRALVIIATALILGATQSVKTLLERGRWDRSTAYVWLGVVMLPVVGLVLAAGLAGDLGPAVITSAAVAAIMWRALGRRVVGWLVLIGAVVFLVGAVISGELVTRWADVLHPRRPDSGLQLATALRGMGSAGFIGGGPGSGSLAGSLPAKGSDYVAAILGGDLGILPLLVILGLLVVAAISILRVASCMKIGVPALVVTGVGWSFLITTLWIGAGNFGLLPFTGIDIPLLALNGSSGLSTGICIGALGYALRSFDPDTAEVSKSGKSITTVALVAAVVVGAIALVQSVHLMWTGGRYVAGACVSKSTGEVVSPPTVPASGGVSTSDPAYRYLGDVQSDDQLPSTGSQGDTYRMVETDEDNRVRTTYFVWNEDAWEASGQKGISTVRACIPSGPYTAQPELDPAWQDRTASYDSEPSNLDAEALRRMPRGDLILRDGTALASSEPLGRRIYTDATTAIDTGFFTFGTSAGPQGLEYSASGALTCGLHRSFQAQLTTLGFYGECSPTTVVSSIEPALQSAVQGIVLDASDYSTMIMVVNQETGGVEAVASTVAEQVPRTDSAEAKVSLNANALKAGDTPFIQREILAYRAKVAPSPPFRHPPYLPLADDAKSDDIWPPAFGYPVQPGSVFKLITAAAAGREQIAIPSLGQSLEIEGEKPLTNQSLQACPGTSIQAMLAYSCNTSAGYIGIQVGSEGLYQAADALGLAEAGSLIGPPDESADLTPILWQPFGANHDSLNIPDDPSESELARAAIGQENVRFSVAQEAGITKAVLTGVRQPLTMVAGVCDAKDFRPWQAPTTPVPADIPLDVIREGMEGAVEWQGGTAEALQGRATMAKTGTAELNDGIASWVTATDGEHIVVVRMTPTVANSDPRELDSGAKGQAIKVFDALQAQQSLMGAENPCSSNE